MLDDEPGVDEVEGTFGQRFAEDVVLADLEVGRIEAVEVQGADVGGQHLALAPDPVGQPASDRAGAGTDLQPVPPGSIPSAASTVLVPGSQSRSMAARRSRSSWRRWSKT